MMSEFNWNCGCGQVGNTGKFCINCGKKRPESEDHISELPKADPILRTEQPAETFETLHVVTAEPVQPQSFVPAQPVQQMPPYGYGGYAVAPQNVNYVNAAQVPPVQQKTSSASVVLGIFSILCLFVQPLGALLGLIGLITSRRSGTAGKVLSILGLVLGLIFLVIDLLVAYTILTSK